MILYANGCSHTAAAEAVVSDCFAEDDGRHGIDRRPHPKNLKASWCTHVAKALNYTLICDAESGSSNARIIRTTTNWIDNNQSLWPQTLIMIQWTTWERQEWLHKDIWYQVNASGTDWLPNELRLRYKKYIDTIDWTECTQQAHLDAWNLHLYLKQKNIKHLFFSGHSTFSDIVISKKLNGNKKALETVYPTTRILPWGVNYMHPYEHDYSFHNWLVQNGGQYANPQSYHFDAKSHRLWANYVLQYLYCNQLVDCNSEVPTD